MVLGGFLRVLCVALLLNQENFCGGVLLELEIQLPLLLLALVD